MQSIIARGQKELAKQNLKNDKLFNTEKPTDIEYMESVIVELKQKAQVLKSQITTDEGTYLSVAKDKKEKKLKSGKNEKYIVKCQSIIDGCKVKVEQKKTYLQAKIDKLEAEKRAYILEVNAKIEKLEADISLSDTLTENTISYHQSQIEDAYEDIPLVVVYPPTHHKKKEELREILSSIELMTSNIQILKAVEYDQKSKDFEHDKQIRKLKEESDRIAAEESRAARYAEEEEEQRLYIEKRRNREAEEQRVRARAIEREKEKAEGIIVTPNYYSEDNDEQEEEQDEDYCKINSEDERETARERVETNKLRASRGLPPLRPMRKIE